MFVGPEVVLLSHGASTEHQDSYAPLSPLSLSLSIYIYSIYTLRYYSDGPGIDSR